MAIEGPLRELSIHDVFQLLDLSRKTGVLRVTSDLRQNAGTVYFADGAVVYAEIRSNPHLLGELLVRSGRVSRADLEQAREVQRRQGDSPRLGEILVNTGVITARERQRYVRLQVEEVVFEITSWTEGHFSFTEGAVEPLAPDVQVRIRVEALLMEAARRIDEWARIEKRISHLGVIPALAPAPDASEGQLDLLPPEWEVLALIDGVRDVRGIAAELGRSDFDVAKTLFGLESAGVVVLVQPAAARGGAEAAVADAASPLELAATALAARDVEGARALAERAVAEEPSGAAAHLLLGRVHLAGGRAVEAAHALARALRLEPRNAAAHRVHGFVLAALGRFREAVDAWEHWERLAVEVEAEDPFRDEVQRACEATRVLAGVIGHA